VVTRRQRVLQRGVARHGAPREYALPDGAGDGAAAPNVMPAGAEVSPPAWSQQAARTRRVSTNGAQRSQFGACRAKPNGCQRGTGVRGQITAHGMSHAPKKLRRGTAAAGQCEPDAPYNSGVSSPRIATGGKRRRTPRNAVHSSVNVPRTSVRVQMKQQHGGAGGTAGAKRRSVNGR